MIIRKARKSDSLNLAVLSIQVWLHTYAKQGVEDAVSKYVMSRFTQQHFEILIGNPDYGLVVATEGHALVGYCLANLQSSWTEGEEGKVGDRGYEVETLYVQEHWQGRGIGRDLLINIAQLYGPRFWLSSWVHNESISFYKYLGFEDIGSTSFTLGEEQHENRVLAFSGTLKR